MNIVRRLRDVEELERGIAVNLLVLPCRGCDRPGLIAGSPMLREHSSEKSRLEKLLQPLFQLVFFLPAPFSTVLLENSEHR
jgi:hypothetical protein